MQLPALSSNTPATRSAIVLIPFHALEATSVAEAAKTAGKCESTIRTWCRHHQIGRRIGGAWAVSKVALAMLLEEDFEALARYHRGRRVQDEAVAWYYRRLELSEILNRAEFQT
jgi:hypothetical protein